MYVLTHFVLAMPKALKNANLLCYPSARVTSSVYDSDDGMTVERPLASLDKAFVTFEVGKQYFKVRPDDQPSKRRYISRASISCL